ncbi:MAG: hypothetical protein KC616_26265, partial [Myxococcales bacterium]|nr:hypothetical protein [Myxococcales bacterium]
LPELERAPESDARFTGLPAAAERAAQYAKWSGQLETTVYRDHALELFTCKSPKLVSSPGEDEGAFRGRLADLVHADRDLEIEKLRKKYAPKLARLQERIARAQDKVEREEEQYADRKTQTVVSLGATLLGAVFGRKLGSAGNIGRAASTMRGASRAARERADIGRAEDRVEALQQQLAELEAEFQADLDRLEDGAADFEPELDTLRVAARKGDLEIERLHLVWIPSRVDADDRVELVGSLGA